jgi:proteasome lid subunit RPN8/RPN11
MSVGISRALLDRVLTHTAREPAREACGLLLGTLERVEEMRVTVNVAADPTDSFEIDPAALFAAIRAERTGGARLIGHYHSHPTGNAMPSARDALAVANPGRLWLIVAAGEARLWREVVGGEIQGAFEAVPLVVDAGISG